MSQLKEMQKLKIWLHIKTADSLDIEFHMDLILFSNNWYCILRNSCSAF